MTISATYTDLGDGVIHMDAEYLNPGVASVYLIIDGQECAIIETGTCHTIPYIMDVLEKYGLSEDNVRYVIPTHVHLDHAGGVGGLMEHCPNASLVIHPLGARHMVDPSKLSAGAMAVYGEEAFNRLYGVLKPVEASRVIEAPDLMELTLGERTLRFYDTPGHAKHHFCVHDLSSNSIFSGDTFGISYPSLKTASNLPFIFATTTPVQFDPDAMYNSIEKLMAAQPTAFNLTHYGRVIPTPELVTQLKDSIGAYLKIAAQAQNESSETRCTTMNDAITCYLLGAYQAMGGTESEAIVREVIAMDSKLNAQGLDFWLSKQSKAVS